tara:strand:- start:662 stop:2728 length:2067 start_codon:yes stop_codon:yes gene_type:complete
MENEELIKKLVQKISDGTVTVGEFLASAKLQNPKTAGLAALSAYFPQDNIPLDTPWKEVATEETVAKMLDVKNELTTSATFTNIQSVEKEAEAFYKKNKNLIDNPSPYMFTQQEGRKITGGEIRLGNAAIARSFGKKEENPKAYQTRGTRKFKKVPKADITVPKLIQATKVIKNADTRAAVAFNLLVPFRPGEVAGLLIDDVDLETGLVSAFHRGNKTRTELFLPEVSLEILRDQIAEAKKAGRTTVFNTSVNEMTKAIKAKGGLKDLLKENKATLGREIIGISDIRKLVPSLLAKELGADAALVSSILGHTEGADSLLAKLATVTSQHYVSAVEDAATDPKKHALNVIQHTLASNIGAETLNELPASFGVSAKRLTEKGAIAIKAISTAPDPTLVPEQEGRPLTKAQQKIIKARQKATLASVEADESEALLRKVENELKLEEKKKALLEKQLDPETIKLEAELKERRRIAGQEAKLLGEPADMPSEKKPLPEVNYKTLGFSEEDIKNIEAAKLEGPEALKSAVAEATQNVQSNKTKALKEALKKGAIKGAVALGTGGVGAALFAADVVAETVRPTRMGGAIEDANEETLLRSLETGEALPGSGDISLDRGGARTGVEQEVQNIESSKRRSAMEDEASQYELMSGAPSPDQVEEFGEQMTEGFAQAKEKYEESPFYKRYEAYFVNRPN